MTKKPDKSSWKVHYNDKSASGIEIKSCKGKVVNFILIKHDEVLDKNYKPHRITIRLDEKSKPILPPPQTFEEMIQAKRRQQQLLFGPLKKVPKQKKNSNSHPATPPTHTPTTTPATSTTTAATLATTATTSATTTTTSAATATKTTTTTVTSDITATTPATTATTSSTTSAPCNTTIVTSIKDLTKQESIREAVDPKELKMLLKLTPPGGQITLPNGTIFRKSRRGGARAGAGRKRSKPSESNQDQQTQQQEDSSSFSQHQDDEDKKPIID